MENRTEYTYDVFISYHQSDLSWVKQELLPRLYNSGLRVCIDYRDFEIGVPTLRNIEISIENSRHTLLVLTPAWAESEWANFESLLAGTSNFSSLRRMLPLLVKPCHLPGRIKALSLADLTSPADYDEQFRRLLLQIHRRSDAQQSLQPTLSPFIAGPPIVHPASFFGRTRELKRILSLLRDVPMQNTAIIGQRRSGKTSLLLHLRELAQASPEQLRPDQHSYLDRLPKNEPYRWVFVDFQDHRVSTQEGLLSYLLENMDMPIPQPCTIEAFMHIVPTYLQTRTVVLLDEIGKALEHYEELHNAFWESLRSLTTTQLQGRVAFVIASHDHPMSLARNVGLGSPFFNIFGYASWLGPFTFEESHDLVASAPIPFPEDDVQWIIEQSKGWPLLIQMLCRERWLSMDEPGEHSWRADALRQIEPFLYLKDT